eukprot:30672-Pelagococcus_subviridis.AAC.6
MHRSPRHAQEPAPPRVRPLRLRLRAIAADVHDDEVARVIRREPRELRREARARRARRGREVERDDFPLERARRVEKVPVLVLQVDARQELAHPRLGLRVARAVPGLASSFITALVVRGAARRGRGPRASAAARRARGEAVARRDLAVAGARGARVVVVLVRRVHHERGGASGRDRRVMRGAFLRSADQKVDFLSPAFSF